MKAKWKDYKYGAWLVLIFGVVDAKIVDLDGSDSQNKAGRWGIITHPNGTWEINGTRAEAKAHAESMLNEVLHTALLRLKG